MYFGSVKFFKQQIYSSVICFALCAAFFALLFGIRCSAPSNIVPEELPSSVGEAINEAVTNGKISIPDNATISDIYHAISEKGYTPEEIICFIAENDSEALDSFISAASEKMNSDAAVYETPEDDYPTVRTAAGRTALAENQFRLFFENSPSDNTRNILSELDNVSAKATFLVDAGCTEMRGDTFRKIVSKGSSVGIKLNKNYDTISSCLDEIAPVFAKITESTGIAPTVIAYDEEPSEAVRDELSARGFELVRIDIHGDSVEDPDWSSVYTNTVDLAEAKGSGVICLNGGNDAYVTITALSDIITRLKDDGYFFGTKKNL